MGGSEKLSVVELTVPSHVAYREVAARTTALVCKLALAESRVRDTGRCEALTHQLVSAVGEAFNNIALHGFGDRDPSPVTIVMSFDGISVRVELRDHGAPFDPDRVAAPDLDSLPESGLGLYIIRAFVDRLDYRPGSPNVLVLTRYLDRAPTA